MYLLLCFTVFSLILITMFHLAVVIFVHLVLFVFDANVCIFMCVFRSGEKIISEKAPEQEYF